MTSRPLDEDPVHVLAHARWLDALARELVADPGRAADLVQDTQVSALSARPDPDRPLRGWLATVMRNLRRQQRRSELRREARERESATREDVQSAASLAARLEAHRRVVDAVASLDERYRATILLRYFEGRSPSRIAADQGIPVATVKTRLARGLALLRGRLDRDYGGDGRSWALALVPLAKSADAALVAAGIGATLMNVKIVVAAAALALAAGVFLYSRTDPTPGPSTGGSTPAADVAGSPAAPPVIGSSAVRRPVAEVEAPALAERSSEVASPPAPAPVSRTRDAVVHGRVLDVLSQPVAGVELEFVLGGGEDERIGPSAARRQPDGATAPAEKGADPIRSGPDGSFACEAPADWTRLVAKGKEYATVYAATRGMGGRDRLVVVIAKAVAYSGVVVDEGDVPVAGAAIELRLPHGFRHRFADVLDASSEQAMARTTPADGRFAFDRAPEIEGATLRASHLGFEPALAPAIANGSADLRLVLRRPMAAEERVEGVVVDPAGALVEGAYVSLRGEVTITDSAGRFAIDVDDTNWSRRLAERFRQPPEVVADHLGRMGLGRESPLGTKLVAVKKGLQPGTFLAQPTADGPVFPSFVVLQLGPEPLAIEGTVLGADGAPKRGATVWVDDPTLLGMLDSEGETLLENAMAGARGFQWRTATTDADGKFRLDGLIDRAYRLVAMDENLLRVASPAVPAGTTGAVLRFPADAVHAVIRGRVVTLRGKPVPGARVRVQNDAFHVGGSTQHAGGESVESDDEGRFELNDVPKEGVYLRVDGEGILPLEYARDKTRLEDESDRPVTEIELRVSARCHLRIELSDPDSAAEFGVVDRDGQGLPIDLFQGNSRETRDRFDIVGGRSPVVAAPQDAAFVVLYRDRKEVRRIPVELSDVDVNTIKG